MLTYCVTLPNVLGCACVCACVHRAARRRVRLCHIDVVRRAAKISVSNLELSFAKVYACVRVLFWLRTMQSFWTFVYVGPISCKKFNVSQEDSAEIEKTKMFGRTCLGIMVFTN